MHWPYIFTTSKSRLAFVAIGIAALFSSAWYGARTVVPPPSSFQEQIDQFGPRLAAALGQKSAFERTASGYQPRPETPVAPAGLKPAELQAWRAMAQRLSGPSPLAITFPEHYSEGTLVASQGMSVTIKPVESNAAAARIEDGKLVYANAYASTDSIQVVSSARSEEFLLLHDNKAPQRFEYDVSTMAGVKDFSLKEGTVHFKSAQGRSLEIEAPWLIDAGGQRIPNAVSWELSYPNGPSQPRLALVVNNAGHLHYPVVIDPTWVATNSVMNSPRVRHTSTLLNSGKVLVAGGFDVLGNPVAQAEIYDPATGIWTATGSMNTARAYHTAILLQNGEVLVAGGTDGGSVFASAELYNPTTGTWTTTGSLRDKRCLHTATLLPDGDVLVTGGSEGGPYLSSSELYHPATGTWMVSGSLNAARYAHTAALLPNGQVLVTGGLGVTNGINGSQQVILASSELYDPSTGIWTLTGNLNVGRFYHEATLLNSGLVLVSGGSSDYTVDTAITELYNPANGTWTQTGSMATARDNHTTTLLPTGEVVAVGGEGPGGQTLNSTEIYDPGTGTWTSGATLTVPHSYQTTTLLPNGQLLVAGGYAPTYSSDVSEIYDPSVPSFSATGNLNTARYGHTATLLPNGKVLVAGGGQGQTAGLTDAELYDPSQGTWAVTGSLNAGRGGHTATLLSNGQVLVAGGVDGLGNFLNSSELYDSGTGTWTTSGSLTTARDLHTATLLPNGQVLVAGGNGSGGSLSSAEIYDPTSGAWIVTGSLKTGRAVHTATLLPSGLVLVASGEDSTGNPLASAELYDPNAGTWSYTGNLKTARYRHTATLLPNGQVLIAGGGNVFNALKSSELYDPSSGTFATTGNLNTAREEHTASLLSNGQVLIAGGESSPGSALSSGELYDPETGLWTATGPQTYGAFSETSTLLPNSEVLIAGGTTFGQTFASCNLFDPTLGYVPAAQPQIDAIPAITVATAVELTGTKFTGISEGSGGSKNASASNIPVVQLQSLVNEQTVNVTLDPAQGFTPTTFTSLPTTHLAHGFAMMTMFVNGTPSHSQIVNYNLGTQHLAFFAAPQILGLDASPYSLPATTSAGLPVSYSVVSGPATVSGNTLTLTGAGTVVLAAEQAGNVNYLGLSTQQTITVKASANFSAWEGESGHFTTPQLNDQSISGSTAMPENDGVPNLLKYAFNINPATAMSSADRAALPAVSLDTTTTPGTAYLALTYRKYALLTNALITVQTSPDLQMWTTVTPDLSQQIGTDPVTGDPIMEVGVISNGAGPGFIRLRVTGQ